MSNLKCKKLLNSLEKCVDENLEGLVAVNTGISLLEGHRVALRSDIQELKDQGKVVLLCGGGSGHEPAHAGYIGQGMLSAVVAGSIFASPPPKDIVAALRAIGKDNKAGCLTIVKNYTGDRLNFGLAVERVKREGINVEVLLVGEDCALKSADKTAGRRGLCGGIFIHKIAGALAEKGKSLKEIHQIASQAASQMGTIGVSLGPCAVPGSGPSFQLESDVIELGLGIHGEAGVSRHKLVSAKKVVQIMVDHMTNPENSTHINLGKGDKIALIVNNLGGLSGLELNIVAKEAIEYLETDMLVMVDRAYCGTFMTSLEMPGVSITVMILDDTFKECLDAPTTAPAWQRPYLSKNHKDRNTPRKIPSPCKDESDFIDGSVSEPNDLMYDVIQNVCNRCKESESRLNELDKESGDGDCGSTISRGADAVLRKLGMRESPGLPLNNPSALALTLSELVEQSMGGSSGGFYSLFLTAASQAFISSESTSEDCWEKALHLGIQAIMRFGGAEPGDRTMIDSLHAASSVLANGPASSPKKDLFAKAVEAAEKAAEATAGMKAHAGRASYVNPDKLRSPDPGAIAVAVWLRAILEQV